MNLFSFISILLVLFNPLIIVLHYLIKPPQHNFNLEYDTCNYMIRFFYWFWPFDININPTGVNKIKLGKYIMHNLQLPTTTINKTVKNSNTVFKLCQIYKI